MLKKGFLILIGGLFLMTGCKEEAKAVQKVSALYQSTVYYFHGNARCMSCYKIEKYTTEVFNENFKDKFDYKIVNTDNSDNKHFLEDYQLYSKALVLVKIKDGKEVGFKNLDKIWVHLGNEALFKSYVKDEITQFLLK